MEHSKIRRRSRVGPFVFWNVSNPYPDRIQKYFHSALVGQTKGGGGGREEGEERRRIRLVSIDRELEIGGRMIIKRLILFTFALSSSPLQEEGRGNRSVSEISIKRRTETSWK